MPKSFQRDRFFWIVALQTAIVNFYLGGFGPAQSLLRADQGTSLTVAGLHGAALGIASIAAGYANPHLAHKFGRAKSQWIGLTIFAVGLLMFIVSPPVVLTLPATLVTGFGVSIVINTMLTSMSHHFGKAAEIAIPQANGVSSVGFIIGTGLIGTVAIIYPSFWRLGLLLALPAVALLMFVGREKGKEDHVPDEGGPQSGKMSPKFWLAWCGFVACISSEFATSFWASALLKDRVGSTAAISTVAVVAYGVGLAIGRWYGGHVLKKIKLDNQLFILISLQFIGFITFWLSHAMLLSLISLMFVGMGISMQFGLSAIRLVGFSDGRPDLAVGRSSLGAGIAIAGAPFLLGFLGDNFGISRAYIMVPVLIVIAFILIKMTPSQPVKA
ncbi:MAG: MFS transporter [Actinomycetes bacterium]